MPHPVSVLVSEARQALGTTQLDLAARLGVSRSTGQRWDACRSVPAPAQLHELARLVHPVDADLAKRIAAAGGATLEALGIVVPPPPLQAPAEPPTSAARDRVVDAVVCAAAEAADAVPHAVRPVLLAAFTCARELGLTVEAVERGLARRLPARKPGRAPAGKSP